MRMRMVSELRSDSWRIVMRERMNVNVRGLVDVDVRGLIWNLTAIRTWKNTEESVGEPTWQIAIERVNDG